MRHVVFNQKGGVGKSTITCNLAAISAAQGRRTLVVDLDPQGNASQYLLGEKYDEVTGTLADYFNEVLAVWVARKGVRAAVHPTPFPRLDIMPSNRALDDLHTKLESRYKMYKLREALDSMGDYDAVFIDTPPALNFYTRSALIAADSCLIPFDCDAFSRRAIYTLLDSVGEIQQDHNAKLRVEGIVVNHYQTRAKLPRKLVDELLEEGLPILKVYLSSSVRIRESHDRAKPMVHLDPRHKVTQEFTALHEQLLESAPSPVC